MVKKKRKTRRGERRVNRKENLLNCACTLKEPETAATFVKKGKGDQNWGRIYWFAKTTAGGGQMEKLEN